MHKKGLTFRSKQTAESRHVSSQKFELCTKRPDISEQADCGDLTHTRGMLFCNSDYSRRQSVSTNMRYPKKRTGTSHVSLVCAFLDPNTVSTYCLRLRARNTDLFWCTQNRRGLPEIRTDLLVRMLNRKKLQALHQNCFVYAEQKRTYGVHAEQKRTSRGPRLAKLTDNEAHVSDCPFVFLGPPGHLLQSGGAHTIHICQGFQHPSGRSVMHYKLIKGRLRAGYSKR